MAGVAKAIHDRISPESTGRIKHFVRLDTHPNCVSINKDCSQIVVAGRSVFKVFAIEEDRFVEKLNLRAVRHTNLSYCTSDVSWNPGEDHILASASTNGAVVIWNLNANSRNKQDQVISNEHKRTVTRVNFHKFEHHLLVSGSLDGYMKLFDLRKREVSSSFDGKSDAIRDVQFNPHQYFQFAATFDSGNVQVWDMRYPTRMERQFTAHSGPCFSMDWHPEDSTWLATAGRDKMIKVWDMASPKPYNLHQVQTITSVAQIKWRPMRKHHIASCAFILDYSVNVWDIRRPYIPFAAFEDHKDIVTGIVWKPGDPHVFYSSSKDNTLFQHIFHDANRPADKANPVGVAISVRGDVALATNDKLVSPGKTPKMSSFFRRGPDRSEQFTKVTSICNEFELTEEADISMDWLLHSAKHYKLTGRPLAELCDLNANIALTQQRFEVAQTWNMLKLFYGSTTPLTTTPAYTTHKQDSKDTDNDKTKSDKPPVTQEAKAEEAKDRYPGDTSTGVSEDDSEGGENETDQDRATTLANIASGLNSASHSDFFFGDGALEQADFDYDTIGDMTNGQDWNLPIEAFQPRLEIVDRPTSPDPVNPQQQGSGAESPSSVTGSDFSTTNPQITNENTSIKQEILGCLPFQSGMPAWHHTQFVCDMLHQHADKGDVQTCVAVLIVLGEKIRPHIDLMTQAQWLHSYIDLLYHYQLYCEAADVMKLCNHPSVGTMNQDSTHLRTNCSSCSKHMERGGWLCDRCKGYVNTCSICHHPVKGLYVWCQGCSHGGHLQHMKEWLSTHKECPVGCGHICEYSL